MRLMHGDMGSSSPLPEVAHMCLYGLLVLIIQVARGDAVGFAIDLDPMERG